jgi:hypothetical protein
MALQIDTYIIFIAIGLILGVFPFVGRLMYVIKHKVGRLLSVYFLGVVGLFGLNMILYEPPINLQYTLEIFNLLKGIKFVYILSIILFFFGGFGLFGSIAEKSFEVLEEIDLLSTLERRKSILKQYFGYLFFGYVFVFSVYALSKLLLLLLGVTPNTWLMELYTSLGFESVFLVLVGTSLFLLKSFKYGVFSREFHKNLSVEESEDTAWRTTRKLVIIFVFVWAVYITFILFFIQIFKLETQLFTGVLLSYIAAEPIFHSLQIVFYITTTFQTLYFLTHIYKLVSSLKSVDPNYKKKVDETIKIDPDEEIKF